MDGFRGLLERQNRAAFMATLGQGIFAGTSHAAEAGGLQARFGERCDLKAAQTKVSPFAADDRSENPTLRARVINEQVKTVAVGISTRCDQGTNADRGEAFVGVSSQWLLARRVLLAAPHIAPHSKWDGAG